MSLSDPKRSSVHRRRLKSVLAREIIPAFATSLNATDEIYSVPSFDQVPIMTPNA